MLSILKPSFKQKIKTWLQYKRQEKKLRLAIDLAEKQHRLTGKQYHVLSDGRGNFTVLNNSERKILNRRLRGKMKLDIKTLREIAVYSTDNNVKPLKI